MYKVIIGSETNSTHNKYSEAEEILKTYGFKQDEYQWVKGTRIARIQRVTDSSDGGKNNDK